MIGLIETARAVTISASIPGSYDTSAATATPGQFIADFYQYALIIGGLLAFGVIVYGGIRYMTSAGNPSGQGDAKDWIQAAIMGILLLAGAYFILKVINPNLVNLTLPDNLQSVGKTNNTSAGTGNAGGTGGTTTGGTTQTASTCKATSNGGTSGTCPNLSDGTAQNCCYANGGAICQKDACAASVTCGSVDSKGNSQSGSCPSNQSCYSYKGWTGKTTYNCKVKGFL